MLRAQSVDTLRTGMKVGRNVLDLDGKVLVKSGTILSDNTIRTLNGKNVFSVYIDVPEEEIHIDITGNEHLLDGKYLDRYKKTYNRVQNIYYKLGREDILELADLEEVLQEENIKELCDGATAVTQIHNMTRDGDYVIHHATNVAILAGLMAKWMRVNWDKTRELVMAGLLSEVGKMKVPRTILDKTGKLEPEELDKVKRHVDYGYDMLKRSELKKYKDVLLAILQHHERCDGSGYPNRLKADAICDYAKIVAILDIYDAMAANRSYAKRNSPFDVFKIIYEDVLKGKLDTKYGIKFIGELCHALTGNWVGLSNGERAKIVYIAETRVTALPIVQTVKGDFYDLNTRHDIKIEALLTANEVN
ncbi:MAG: HD domain-containing protein [Selenomonadaceae bacterium]|nr:HD domain-containing protein [Selenomonadaceae bacterium]